ncbi:RAD9, HUS1, RAD1-interacting nuclear orphan protein 1 [Pristis pectinata]|uniref:RAD9, HUS1, RAD1-interacting nuclear orphan protein 1 n=1 Tax=Pristis pectinata TaxID=685728 RepID=UPI00223E27EE|nr:RAD9, HUS1, RAD1-interacting nuclear orphan protein 1 [Pristis pectinata]XP_051886441.1 RAD9, HUS1, RAD1-interacting nuclear orphan protein 1 [Pristis pectinata]
MPRKKKSSQFKKPPLLFLESPLKGEKCKQVLSIPSAINPRQVSCIPVDQRSAFTWVLPEFDTTTPRREEKSDRVKQHSICNKQGTASKTGAVRKLHMNFVPLTFLGSGGIPVQKENHKVQFSTCQNVQTHGKARFKTNKTSFMGSSYRRCRVDTCGKAQNSDALDKQKYSLRSAAKSNLVGKSTTWNLPVKSSSFCPPINCIDNQTGADLDETEISLSEHFSQSSDEVFTLPQVSTPTTDGLLLPATLKKNICGVLRNNELNKDNTTPLPGGLLDCLDKCSGLKDDFSEEAPSADVLVQDTPEHEYGLKATWRRRPHIMQFLKDHGKLTSTDVLVGS